MQDEEDPFDANVPLPVVRRDAGPVTPGDPPEGFEGELCAVDTNKLYEISTTDKQPEPTQIGVDVINSHFTLSFVDLSPDCLDMVRVADLSGAADIGTPEIVTAFDPCANIERASIAHNGNYWLLATVDDREGLTTDIWVQGFDGERGFDARRITEAAGRRGEVALSASLTNRAMVAWFEPDITTGTGALYVRALSGAGEPTGALVQLEPSGTWSFSGVALAHVGERYAALGYRRSDGMGRSEIVLDVLDVVTGERDRDPWVLSANAGDRGSIDIAADELSAGVMYSIIQGSSHQLWFQQLDLNVRPAKVLVGSTPLGDQEPLRIVGPPQNAVDASLAKLPLGFAVAYRSLVGVGTAEPRIRVDFLDKVGIVLAGSDVALASEAGGRTAIKSAYDGRIVLGWSDAHEDGTTTLTAVKLPCVGGL
jgi:hypothetical protein